MFFCRFRRVQLPICRSCVQEAVLVLLDHDLCAWVHAGDSLMGVILVGSVCSASQGVPGGYHFTYHVDTNSIHQQFVASSCLHQSHRRLAGWGESVSKARSSNNVVLFTGCLRHFCVLCPVGICLGQLCLAWWPVVFAQEKGSGKTKELGLWLRRRWWRRRNELRWFGWWWWWAIIHSVWWATTTKPTSNHVNKSQVLCK